MHTLKLTQIGNSVGAVFPRELLNQLQLDKGDSLYVIARRNGSCRETFTVRRVSYGIGVERTFPLHSPRVDHIEIIRRGKVRRAKLYYLRGLQGKAAKIKDVSRD